MSITFNSQELKQIILASSFMYGSTQITNTIGIRSYNGYVNIYINNMNEYFISSFKYKGDIDDMEFALDGKLLKSIISKSKGSITFSVVGEEVHIISEKNKIKFKKIHFSDILKAWDVVGDTLQIKQETIKRGSDLIFSIPQKHFKTVYTGLSLILQDGYIEFCGTNELKVSIYKDKCESHIDTQIIIPFEFVNKMRSILYSGDYKVSITTDNRKIMFEFDNGEYNIKTSSHLLNGSYPKYQQLLQTNYETDIEMNVSDILDAQSNLSIFMEQDDLCELHIGNNTEFRFSGSSGDISESVSAISDREDKFYITKDFFAIIKFIQSLGIDTIKMKRLGRFMFIDIGVEGYIFISSTKDI